MAPGEGARLLAAIAASSAKIVCESSALAISLLRTPERLPGGKLPDLVRLPRVNQGLDLKESLSINSVPGESVK